MPGQATTRELEIGHWRHRRKDTMDNIEGRGRICVEGVTHAQITLRNGSGVAFWRHWRG